MLKYTTAREDVKDITNQILAIQAADETRRANNDIEESLDIPRNVRGVDKRYEYTLNQLAVLIGVGDAPHPAKRVGNIYYSAIKNFIKNQYFIMHIERAERSGMTPVEADEYVSLLYSLELEAGRDIIDIVRRLING